MRAEAPHPVRVAIVTLDNHLKGAVERAAAQLSPCGITLSLHAAADWDRSTTALDSAKAAVAQADIVIATMLFLDDHIRAIQPALAARREDCDAMVCLMSAGELTRMTRMGAYRMDVPAKGPLALLKRLRGAPRKTGEGQAPASPNSGERQMRMLRRLPKILRFIPGTAQDVRAYFLTLQYWLAGSDENVVAMVCSLIDRYADGPRAARRGTLAAAPPRDYPEMGVYHPRATPRMAHTAAHLPAPKGTRGTVGLLLLRSYLLGKDAGHYDGLIAAMEASGLRVIPAFFSGLDARAAMERYFLRDGAVAVDAIVNCTGFSLVGGPAYNDAGAAVEILARFDVPYIAAHAVEFQTIAEWRARPMGLVPLEATMMVALPELDGAICPSVFGGRSPDSAATADAPINAMRADPERAAALAAKVAGLIALRRAGRADRRLAIVLFNFPPKSGATGTAAHLAVFESLHAVLRRLADEGYDVAVPASVDALRAAILHGNAARFGADANVAARISADDHVRREPHLAQIEAQWGAAPGKLQSDGSHIQVLGAHFGKVFVGVQPGFGYEGDPMRLLFEGGFAPTHAFAAFYRYLRQDFAAHAVLHFGTHGALEFMPGKQAGLSGACWPERLLGDLPNFYLYASNNPSEGILAKRRSGATLISYLTPPLARAGLYRGFAELKASVERWRWSAAGAERAALETLIHDQCAALDLDCSQIADLAPALYELERTLIPEGLHVLGQSPHGAQAAELVDAMVDADAAADRATLEQALAACDEIGAVIHALDGGYIKPAPGGDVLANPAVLPTGRNILGFDPFAMPSRFACIQGAEQAEQIIARHMASGQPFPESLAMVLWGTDNMKSEGLQIAQAMRLIGARPRIDGYGRVVGAELLPLAELGRPRVDVVVTLSGIFRDLLPMQTRMLAQAALLAAMADEPLTQNFVRKHSLAHQAAHGCDLETAALRVFSNAEGAYGANVNQLIDGGVWTAPEELANAFETHKGYAYGVAGAPVQRRDLLQSALRDVDFVYQNLESVEVGITDLDQYVDGLGGVSRSVARAKGSQAPVYIVDATQGAAKVRTLAEQIDLETRTRTLNPKWFEGMLRHGFEGVRHIEQHVTNTVGWSATTGQVAPWVYQRISETFMLDPQMRARLSQLNPTSSARVAGRLLEACERHLWEPDDATLAALHAASDELEDRLEGVFAAQ